MEFLGKEIKVIAVHEAGVEVLRDGYQKIFRFQVFGKPKGLEKAVDEVMFYECLKDLAPGEPLSAEISDQMFDRIKEEYGIGTI